MRQRQGKMGSIIVLVVMLAILGGVVFLYNSDTFENVPPKITAQNEVYWNLSTPLKVALEDASGLRSYKVILDRNGQQSVLLSQTLESLPQQVTFQIQPPKLDLFAKNTPFSLWISATDGSQWNMTQGNTATRKIIVHTDTHKPKLMLLSNSYSIKRGGAATVVFKATDENLQSLYIENDGHRFIPHPFHKEGYYASLVAWPITQDRWNGQIVATDKAGNTTTQKLRFFLKDKKYRTSHIDIKDSFLEGKITDLINEVDYQGSFAQDIDKFLYVNETMRQKNGELIVEMAHKTLHPEEPFNALDVTPFYPLKNAAAVASFGDHRFYRYNGQEVSQSYHYGLDLASIKHAEIVATNGGVVSYADFNGIYGNSVLLHHGLGLYTLYSHCSELRVRAGDVVTSGSVIARTGMTGLALGDHLHFGTLIQGIETRPEEWMDKQWIKLNLTNILDEAKELIDRQG